MTLEAIMKAEMKRRWPEEPRAVGKRALRHRNKTSTANVTDWWSLVRWRA
jgi:hypothetical protein